MCYAKGCYTPQHVVDAPVAEASPGMGDFHDLGAQVLDLLAGLGRVAGQPHKPTRPPLGQIAQLDHDRDGCALVLRRAIAFMVVCGLLSNVNRHKDHDHFYGPNEYYFQGRRDFYAGRIAVEAVWRRRPIERTTQVSSSRELSMRRIRQLALAPNFS
jgi:hypothetical protein